MRTDLRSGSKRYTGVRTAMWAHALDDCEISGGVTNGLTQRSGCHRFAGFAVMACQKMGEHCHCTDAEFGITRLLDAIGKDEDLVVEMSGAAISAIF